MSIDAHPPASPLIAMIEPEISVYFVRPIIRSLKNLGLEREHVFRKLQITESEIGDNGYKIRFGRLLKILETASSMASTCNIGLHLYDDFDLTQFGQFGYLMLTADNLLEGFRAVSEYAYYVDEGTHVSLEDNANCIALCYSHTDERIIGHPEDIVQTLMFFVAYIRTYVDADWYPQTIEFQFARPRKRDLAEYRSILGNDLKFNKAINRLVSDQSVFLKSLPTSDRNLNAFMEGEIRQYLGGAVGRVDFIRHLSGLVEGALASGSHIDSIANQMHCSPRSLQRQLAGWDLKYREIVEYVRLQKALALLRCSKYSVNDIANVLGYSEGSAFIRAFGRWTGKTPMSYAREKSAT